MPRKPLAPVVNIKADPSRKAGGKPLVAAKSDVEAAIPRDRWDRPLILPPDGGEPEAYRRASSVAEVLESHFGLHKWELRLAAEGLAQRPDLVQSVHTARNRTEVGAIVEEAMIHAGRDIPSRNGSTMHALTERLDAGEDMPSGLPSNIVAMLEAYEKATQRFTVLDAERFVVQDTIKVAGTYDRRLRDEKTGMKVIGDLKTGQSLKYLAVKTPAQVAAYASGVWYDLDAEREAHGADRDRGLLIWLPWTDDPSEALCELRWLDLRVGRKAIQQALRIHTFQSLNENQTMLHVKD